MVEGLLQFFNRLKCVIILVIQITYHTSRKKEKSALRWDFVIFRTQDALYRKKLKVSENTFHKYSDEKYLMQ